MYCIHRILVTMWNGDVRVPVTNINQSRMRLAFSFASDSCLCFLPNVSCYVFESRMCVL